MSMPPPRFSQLVNDRSGSPISEFMKQALDNPGLVSLAAGFVDPISLPIEATKEAVLGVLDVGGEEARRALQYGTTIGDPDLRKHLVERLEREEDALPGEFGEVANRLVITNGSQQLLYLILEALIDPGDIVLVERPTYFVFMGAMRARGARVIGVETDAGGLRIDSLEETLANLEAVGELERVKLVYTVSEHSNPTGLSLAADRRGPLVEAVRRFSKNQRIFILEDAAYRGLTFGNQEPPSVWRYDEDQETVILARTFSKTFSPGLKTGYGVLPESLLGPVLDLKGNHDFGSNNFAQLVLDRALAEGRYDDQIARLRRVYQTKRDVMLEALETHLSDFEGVSWTEPAGGLYIWLTVPEDLDTGRDGPLFAKALEHEVLYVPGAYAYPEEPGPIPNCHARLSFGVPSADQLREGVRRLAKALRACSLPIG